MIMISGVVVDEDVRILTRDDARRKDLDVGKTNISIIDNKQNILRNILWPPMGGRSVAKN